jgi:two-component system, chemotaxis family, protein-glutamate methylesterase/glutaminase
VTDTRKSRVLVVDDSAVIRRLLTSALAVDPAIEVVAEAADVFTANELIGVHHPDVVTLDVEMPRMDGLAFLRHLMKHNPTAVIVVSSFTPAGSAASIEALRAGAVDVIPKPQNPQGVAPFAARLRRRIHELRACALRLRPITHGDRVERARRVAPTLGRTARAIVAIGASTGGPPAVERVLAAMAVDSPPILIVQHMPASFTRMFAKHLDETAAIRVVEAGHQQPLKPGTAYLAPGDYHLTVGQHEDTLRAILKRGPMVHRQRPSVDVLFESLARLRGIPIVGVLLTGMGEDGADGMVALTHAGHATIAEDEQSCVVFGMPREAIARGGARHTTPLERIPAVIAECLALVDGDRSQAPKATRAIGSQRRTLP